jgi:hypothetical protein
MEGIYFYWLAWMAWIWATFFMDKSNPSRLKLAAVLLAVIITSSYYADVFVFKVNYTAFAIAIFLFYETKKKKLPEFLYLFVSSFIIMLAYTSFLLFELFDPVWILFDRKIMLASCGFYLSVLLYKKTSHRFLSLAGGFLQGEILYAAVLWKFHFPYTISSLAFLDILFISGSLLFAWSAIETMISAMSRSTISQAEGEEHKTT